MDDMYEWDERKNGLNAEKHGVTFEESEEFKWDLAVVIPDERRDYGEKRYLAYGPIYG